MGTIVHRIKEIKNTPERIRAPVKNWNTGLSFPVSITDHINTMNVNLHWGGGGESYSTLVTFQRKRLLHSELMYRGNTQILPLSLKRLFGS